MDFDAIGNTLKAQVSAVLSAPIPFVVTLLIVGFFIWKFVQREYATRLTNADSRIAELRDRLEAKDDQIARLSDKIEELGTKGSNAEQDRAVHDAIRNMGKLEAAVPPARQESTFVKLGPNARIEGGKISGNISDSDTFAQIEGDLSDVEIEKNVHKGRELPDRR